MISKSQEYELGRIWLKIFRSRVRAYDDPLMQIYLEQLLYNLATYSELEDPRLELVIVKNPTMNAFAVPGGVVGFHTGVFAFAENEDQMASVLAHELAHLSQRHFSRGTEAQKKNSMITMAGLLGHRGARRHCRRRRRVSGDDYLSGAVYGQPAALQPLQ